MVRGAPTPWLWLCPSPVPVLPQSQSFPGQVWARPNNEDQLSPVLLERPQKQVLHSHHPAQMPDNHPARPARGPCLHAAPHSCLAAPPMLLSRPVNRVTSYPREALSLTNPCRKCPPGHIGSCEPAARPPGRESRPKGSEVSELLLRLL